MPSKVVLDEAKEIINEYVSRMSENTVLHFFSRHNFICLNNIFVKLTAVPYDPRCFNLPYSITQKSSFGSKL